MPDHTLVNPDTPCVIERVQSKDGTEFRVKPFETLPDAQAYLDGLRASESWSIVKNSVYPVPVLWKEIIDGHMRFTL